MIGSSVSTSGILIYVIADLACLFLMIPLLVYLSESAYREQETSTLRAMIWSFFIYTIMDILMVFFLDSGSRLIPVWLCYVITIIDELSVLCVAYFWFEFGISRLSFRYEYDTWFQIVMAIPIVIASLLSLTSPLTKWVFSIDAAGVYQRGVLFYLQWTVIIGYNVIVPILSIDKLRKTHSAEEREKAISLLKFVVGPFIAGIVQIITPFTPVVCLGMAIGAISVYIDTISMQVYNDALTGLNNRRRAEHYLQECIDAASKRNPFYVYYVDVNDFKSINDINGHSEGDRALKIVAEALKMTAQMYRGFAARMGGDEFLLCTGNMMIQDPESVCTAMKENLQSIIRRNKITYPITISIGYTKCDSKEAIISDLFEEADKWQYQKKKLYHSIIKDKKD